MFGRNEEIEKIRKELNEYIKYVDTNQEKIMELIKENSKMITGIQEQMISIAKVQVQHKESISFLLNHATVDEDAKGDFFKLLKTIGEMEGKK